MMDPSRAKGVVRDPIHGFIPFTHLEYRLMQHPFLRRLHDVKQLGLSYLVFPGASHTRFSHSVGTMHVAGLIAERVLFLSRDAKLCASLFESCDKGPKNFMNIARLTGLLHDIGHPPLSHQLEISLSHIMEISGWARSLDSEPISRDLAERIVREASKSGLGGGGRKLHEEYTRAFLTVLAGDTGALDREESSLVGTVKCALFPEKGFECPLEELGLRTTALRVLHSIISHDIVDADRLDYLERDGEMTGVVYGKVDTARLIQALQVSGEGEISVHPRGLSALEDIFDARYKMYKNVYHHHKVLAINIALTKAVEAIFEEWGELAPRQLLRAVEDPSQLYNAEKMAEIIRDGVILYSDTDIMSLLNNAATSGSPRSRRWAKSLLTRRDLLPITLLKRPDVLLAEIKRKIGGSGGNEFLSVDRVNSALSALKSEEFRKRLVEIIYRVLRRAGHVDVSEGVILDFQDIKIFDVKKIETFEPMLSIYLDSLARVSSVRLLYAYIYSHDEETHKILYRSRDALRKVFLEEAKRRIHELEI